MSKIPPVTMDELLFANSVADGAIRGSIPIDVQRYKVRYEEDDGATTEFGFGDKPIIRAMFAIKEAFKESPDLWHAVFWRWEEAMRLATWRMSEPYVKAKDDRLVLSPAYIHAVATVAMSARKSVDKFKFSRALKEAAAIYPLEETDWGAS